MVEEQQFLRKQAAEKYRRTHDFNIIAGRYYDDEKERQFVSSRENFEALQGRAQQHRLPPSIRFGEGNEYDIISKKVIEESLVTCDTLFYYGLKLRCCENGKRCVPYDGSRRPFRPSRLLGSFLQYGTHCI